MRGSFIHEKPAGTKAWAVEDEAPPAEQLEQLRQVEALLVLDALAELQERVLGEVAGEAVEPVVEGRRARHREVERAAGARQAGQLVAAGGEPRDVLEHVVADHEVEEPVPQRQPLQAGAQHVQPFALRRRSRRELDVEGRDAEVGPPA